MIAQTKPWSLHSLGRGERDVQSKVSVVTLASLMDQLPRLECSCLSTRTYLNLPPYLPTYLTLYTLPLFHQTLSQAQLSKRLRKLTASTNLGA